MTDDPLAAAKAQARKAAFARRKQAHALAPARASERAAAHLLDELARRADGDLRGRVVAGYRPIRTEIDPTPWMRGVLARGGSICVPMIIAAGAPLDFLEWRPEAAMESGPFGAEIPVEKRVVTPDLVVAPLVAFDALCGRLGYGGGFYDRSLAGLRAAGRDVPAIGFAYAAQEADALPLEPTDVRLDAVVTEEGLRARKA